MRQFSTILCFTLFSNFATAQNWETLGGGPVPIVTATNTSRAFLYFENPTGNPALSLDAIPNCVFMEFTGQGWQVKKAFTAPNTIGSFAVLHRSPNPVKHEFLGIAYEADDICNDAINPHVVKFDETQNKYGLWLSGGRGIFENESNGESLTAVDGSVFSIKGMEAEPIAAIPYGFSLSYLKGDLSEIMAFDPISEEYFALLNNHVVTGYPKKAFKLKDGQWTQLSNTPMPFPFEKSSVAVSPINHEMYIAFQDSDFEDGKISVLHVKNGEWEFVGTQGFSPGGVSTMKLHIDPVSGFPVVGYRLDSPGNTDNFKLFLEKFDGTDWVDMGIQPFSDGVVQSYDLGFHTTTHELHVMYQVGQNITVKHLTQATTSTDGPPPELAAAEYWASPNPFAQTVYFGNGKDPIRSVEVFDMTGRSIWQESEVGANPAVVQWHPGPQVPTGLLFFRVKTSDETGHQGRLVFSKN